MIKKTIKKDFVWIGLRVSFWIMILIWVGEIIFLPNDFPPEAHWLGFMAIISLLYTVSIFFTFVVSIVHLVKYKEKAFAIVSLVISSIQGLIFLIGFLIGVIEAAGLV